MLSASIRWGVDPRFLTELYEYWCNGFELAQQPLFGLPGFRWRGDHGDLRFWHVRSSRPHAVPLLLLHGFSGSLAEFAGLAPQLCEPKESSRSLPAFHVVCPALDDIEPSLESRAEACAALMRSLGYVRYLVHGSDTGATVAVELAARSQRQVAGAHVTQVPVYPGDAEEMRELSSHEKSQLIALSERYDRTREPPATPLDELGFALGELSDAAPEGTLDFSRDLLLTALSLTWSTASEERAARAGGLGLLSPRASQVPLAVHSFPLGAPSVRRLVASQHRIAEWHEHQRGGPWPALEQPQLLLESLRTFSARIFENDAASASLAL